ncbi:carboxypeptidase regulatory-like domain-containing protein [Bounagaea algeriensis]
MAAEESRQWVRTARTLTSSLWFPVFFILGFLVFYLLPFHAPSPHNMPVAVVGDQAAAQLEVQLDQKMPDGVDVSAVPSEQEARQAVQDRDVVAAYDPADGELFYGKANGQALMQFTQKIFSPVAQATGQQLQLTDLAPTAAGDVMGTGLFYCLMALNIPPYITVMMLLRAEVGTRQKLLSIVGVGVFASVAAYIFALSTNVIPNQPLTFIPVAFMLTQAIGWTAFGLVPLVKQFIPAVAIGLFVLLSIPSSSGAIPKELVPEFFQVLHDFLPLGQAVDAMRGVFYFGGSGATSAIWGLAAWCALGVALVSGTQWWQHRKKAADPEAVDTGGTYEHEEESADAAADPSVAPPRPAHHRTLAGTVRDTAATAVSGAVITITDGSGAQLARVTSDADGSYEVHDLPEQHVTVVVAAQGMRPLADRIAVRPGRTTGYDFALQPAAKAAARIQ